MSHNIYKISEMPSCGRQIAMNACSGCFAVHIVSGVDLFYKKDFFKNINDKCKNMN